MKKDVCPLGSNKPYSDLPPMERALREVRDYAQAQINQSTDEAILWAQVVSKCDAGLKVAA